jgi:DNA-binding MarR family transcriptional regulator
MSVENHSLGGLAERWDKTFASMDTRVVEPWARLCRVSKLIPHFQREALRPLGLQWSDYQVLAALITAESSDGMLPRELCETLYQTPQGMTKTLDRLEEMRAVQRSPDVKDRRATRVTLSPEGKKLARRVCVAELSWQQEALSSLTKSELTTLNGLLSRVINSLSEQITRIT